MTSPYPGIVYDVVEYKNHIALRFYRDNINRFPDDKQVLIAEWIFKVQKTLCEFVPTTIEMSGD
jgi:hypothetical protein